LSLNSTAHSSAAKRPAACAAAQRRWLSSAKASFAQRVRPVERLHLWVHESPPERAISQRDVAARKCLARLGHDQRGARHRFDAARDQEIGVAGGDGARAVIHRHETRAAQPVDGAARHRGRQPAQQRAHARDVAIVFAGLVGASEDHVVDRRRFDPGTAHDLANHQRTQVIGSYLGQGSPVAADGRAHGVDYEYRALAGRHGVSIYGTSL
jgi:hypothetical protein